MFEFGCYQLDPHHGQLRREGREIRLTQKSFTLLKYFVERPGRIISKDELFEAVWPEVTVSEAALAKRIQELRQALQDDPKAPQYLETMHRRGFRFIKKMRALTSRSVSRHDSQCTTASPAHPVCVGRDTELNQLHDHLETALDGSRQLVWITGEPGIGKTTLVNTFLERARTVDSLWIAPGQCIEQYGSSDPYLPILETLSRLCRQDDTIIDILYHHAPTWLVQMPSLCRPDQLGPLQHQASGMTQPRMLREMAETLDLLTTIKPIVLVLEDLHWSDPATLKLLTTLARRYEAARLLMLATFRPVESLDWNHPLRRCTHELSLHGHSHTLPLPGLDESAIGAYLSTRFYNASMVIDLASFVHRRTEGNPLFITHTVDYLVQQGAIQQIEGQWTLSDLSVMQGGRQPLSMPETLLQLIDYEIGQVSSDIHALLEVASVAGMEFSSASVAAGLELPIETVEEQCETLARRGQFLQRSQPRTWPDGTVTSRYAFIHTLYGEALYQRLSGTRCARLHLRIGEREEHGYGAQADTIAAELALHFEMGRDLHRAIHYHLTAAQNALQRSSCQAAILHANTAHTLLTQLPQSPDGQQYELRAQAVRGFALAQRNGYAAPEVGEAYGRAWELCQQVDNTAHHLPVLLGLTHFYGVRADFDKAYESAEQGISLARHLALPGPLAQAYNGHALALFCLGSFNAARASLEQAITLGDTPQSRMLPEAINASIEGRAVLSMVLWFLGAPDQAVTCLRHTIQQARELENPFALTMSLIMASTVYQYRQDWLEVQSLAEEAVALANQHGFLYWVPIGTFLSGWALTHQDQTEAGIAQIQQSLTTRQQFGTHAQQSYMMGILAESYCAAGQPEAGLHQIHNAFAHVRHTGERHYEAELYRLKGALGLTLDPTTEAEAETCFRRALEISRAQHAKSLELRAATSMARLWQQQGKACTAHALLTPIYNAFTEGLQTADLQAAHVLLNELRSGECPTAGNPA